MWVVLIFPFLVQAPVPLKPGNEFEFKLEYGFRTKPPVDKPAGSSGEPQFAGPQLPYVEIRITPTRLSKDEEKVKVTNTLGHRIYSRKAKVGNEILIDMGFTDDLKDHISVYSFDIVFFSKKGDTSRIRLFVEEDGTLLINGEKQGKF